MSGGMDGGGGAPRDGEAGARQDGEDAPAAARGGCLKLGWGCLPVVVGLSLALPAGLWF
jgi:hypothetical protein